MGWLWMSVAALAAPVELPSGGALASMRARGMGGVCTTLAESATCQLVNPAAVVVRRPGDQAARSLDTTLQAPTHPLFRAVFGGDEPGPTSLRLQTQIGVNAKLGAAGAGLHLRQDGFSTPDGDRLANTWALPVGLARPTFAAGFAPVLVTWQGGSEVVAGGGLSGGLVFAPDDTGLRVGVSAASAVRTRDAGGSSGAVRSPARLTFGVGRSFGMRNQAAPTGADRVRVKGDGAPTLQVLAEMEVWGPSADAVVLGTEATAPARWLARAGAEADVLAQRLRLRAGAYSEPPAAGVARVGHVTAGATTHLATWLDLRWRGGGVVDWSPDGPTVGFGVETW